MGEPIVGVGLGISNAAGSGEDGGMRLKGLRLYSLDHWLSDSWFSTPDAEAPDLYGDEH